MTGRPPRIVQAIRPDVLCLQEVPRRLFAAHRIHAFALACGMRWPGHHRGSGAAILLGPRVRLTFSQHHRLPCPLGSTHPRVCRGSPRSRRFGCRDGGFRAPVFTAAGTRGARPLSDSCRDRFRRGDHLRGLERAGGRPGRGALSPLPLRLVSPLTPDLPSPRARKLLDVVFASPGIEVVPAQPLRWMRTIWWLPAITARCGPTSCSRPSRAPEPDRRSGSDDRAVVVVVVRRATKHEEDKAPRLMAMASHIHQPATSGGRAPATTAGAARPPDPR